MPYSLSSALPLQNAKKVSTEGGILGIQWEEHIFSEGLQTYKYTYCVCVCVCVCVRN
jgi:hypothetical protein